MSYDFIPQGNGQPVHKDVTYELEQFPEDKTEKDLERHVAPAVRHHWQNFLEAIDSRGRPVADIEEGYISSASCIMANVAMKLGRTLNWDAKAQRVIHDGRGQPPAPAPVSQPVGASRSASGVAD